MNKIYDKYKKLKLKDSSKLYLFKNGKFYIFVGDDVDTINNYVVLKKVKFGNDTYKCGFPDNSLNDYLKVFHNHKLNIEIVENFKEETDEIAMYLKKLDLNNITPIESLNILEELKSIYEKRS